MKCHIICQTLALGFPHCHELLQRFCHDRLDFAPDHIGIICHLLHLKGIGNPQQCGKRQSICRIAVFVRRSAQHDLVPAEAGLPKQCIFRRNGLQICRHHVVIDFHHSGFCTDRLHGERYLDLAAGNFLLHLFFQFFFQIAEAAGQPNRGFQKPVVHGMHLCGDLIAFRPCRRTTVSRHTFQKCHTPPETARVSMQ